MGTRADFYVGRGASAEWLGSIAWDGYPDGISKKVLTAKTEKAYRTAVAEFFSEREDVTLPKDGWPWPWEDSNTTDYAYAFDGGKVYGSCFGAKWFIATKPPKNETEGGKVAVFPNMTAVQKVTLGKRSGVMVFGHRADGSVGFVNED